MGENMEGKFELALEQTYSETTDKEFYCIIFMNCQFGGL